jgi:signal transduction histidine kinase
MFKNTRIQFRITVLLIGLLLVSVTLNVIWNYNSQTRQAEKEMLEKTQILDQEMRAVWDFIDINQHRIDTDSNGEYNFKNIYCAVAGKSVAKLFMQENDYEIRYVSMQPRYSNAYPDEFELAAIENFNKDRELHEFYSITQYNERDVFRYVSPIYIKESCLNCHGDPVGELDVTGHAKEGLKIGDLAGTASIIMPIDLYMEGIGNNIWQQSLYFFFVMVAIIVVAIFAISYLVRRLERTNELLQVESQNKSDFLAIMSHEFRTPLTSILAFVDLWEKTDSDLADKDRDAISEVKENSHVLLHMVNNLLEAARIEAGRIDMNYEVIDMVDLVSTVETATRPLAERREISLTTQVLPDVPLFRGDWEKLRRIIENLVSNAVKFTQRGGRVSINVESDRSEQGEQGWILIEVSDTGIGIRDEDLPTLFEKFVQLDKSSYRRYSGSGLGLSVVKDLVEEHGGSITVKSAPKEGSAFTVRIPVVAEE